MKQGFAALAAFILVAGCASAPQPALAQTGGRAGGRAGGKLPRRARAPFSLPRSLWAVDTPAE